MAREVKGSETTNVDSSIDAVDSYATTAKSTDRGAEAAIIHSFYEQPLLAGFRQGEAHREDSMGNHWSVPWSDLMMVMFVLFAALVSANAFKNKEPVPEPVPIDKEIMTPDQSMPSEPSFEPLMQLNVFEKSRQAILETNIENVEIALMDDQSVKVSVKGPLFFDLGEDSLKPEVKRFLNTLSSVIKQTNYEVNVVGHTDDRPISNSRFASNWELSLMRATQVTKHLINATNVDPARFTIMGRSQYEPTNPNSNDEFRSQNRRVEIIITRNIYDSPENKS